ncbi:MAG: DUF4062 domain-containing protein [Chloroflexi bacterium]|nr:DUF4062 domain-containing protein [Chloroflexota bacterium]
MSAQQSPQRKQSPYIRVFVSSTFKDMQAERDELVKFIFPQLRKLCEKRGITWGEVDLRWGITDEQKSDGRVLPICLSEIQHCRPFFIGILGERYGWVPDEIPPELVEREPWLKLNLEHSVTELEILHGVLNNPGMAEHAFFYFRDAKYLETLSSEQRTDLLESDSGRNKQKLADLKDRIRKSGFPVHEDYKNPKEFGQIVLRDLTDILDRLYPQKSQLDPLDREAAENELFSISRTKFYISRQSYFDRLDDHVSSEAEPLMILGESGSGKSALLANWAMDYKNRHPDELVLTHFIGATSGSMDWMAMLRRILGEFNRKFNIQEEIPNKPEALRRAFANLLDRVSVRGRVVLILDALNQLEDRDGAPDLVWLPAHLPVNVRVLLSTLPGRSLDEIRKRGWPILMVEPLQIEERRRLIQGYLALFTKALDKQPMERIAGAAQCQNPLYLRVILDEIRQFGIYELLGSQIEHYLEAQTISALYQLILERCEQDYEQELPGLIGNALSLLLAAKRGLSEVELLELLGTDGQPLPHAYWSPVHLALEQSFLNREGLIVFSHDYLRQAVQNRYLSEESMLKLDHLRLADYFEQRSGESPRRLDELPWQLSRAGEWQRLFILLGKTEFFSTSWEFNPFEFKAYWTQVEANSPYRMVDAYRKVIDHPSHYQEVEWNICILLKDTGHPEEALSMNTGLVDYFRRYSDQENLLIALSIRGQILRHGDNLDGVLALHKEEERISREVGDAVGLAGSIGNQGLVMQIRGDLDRALTLHQEAEKIFYVQSDQIGQAGSLINQALAFYQRGDLDRSEGLADAAEHIFRELGNKTGLKTSLNCKALILKERGDLEGAMALHKEGESIAHELGDKVGLGGSIANQATLLLLQGDLERGSSYLEKAEQIYRELGDINGLATVLINRATLLGLEMDQPQKAMSLADEAFRLADTCGYDRLAEQIKSLRVLIFERL